MTEARSKVQAVSQVQARILVVCLGNICRSPMAEGMLRARIEASPFAGRVELDSAGTGNWHVGHPPDPRAVACVHAAGVDSAGLRGRQLRREDFHHFDWILCADRQNLRDVQALAPLRMKQRASLLLEWAGVPGDGEIPDPYTGNARHFEHVRKLLEKAADGVVARLRRELG